MKDLLDIVLQLAEEISELIPNASPELCSQLLEKRKELLSLCEQLSTSRRTREGEDAHACAELESLLARVKALAARGDVEALGEIVHRISALTHSRCMHMGMDGGVGLCAPMSLGPPAGRCPCCGKRKGQCNCEE